jgi:catechol 2,3-dioxygenase
MTPTAVRAGAFLHHLQLDSAAPEALARFYADHLDMASERLADGRFLCTGPGRRMLFAPGTSRTLGFAAFACRDREGLAELKARAERENLNPAGSPSPLFDADAFAVRDPDGNCIVFGVAAPDGTRTGLRGPLQHVTLGTADVGAIENFYAGKLGFLISDRVVNDKGETTAAFMRSNHEHHTLGCFRSARIGIDHHSYEAGDWSYIRDWSDRFAARETPLIWGPGRHGPGNNLFIFIEDPDKNWIEVSAELETVYDRPLKTWPNTPRTINLWGQAVMRS